MKHLAILIILALSVQGQVTFTTCASDASPFLFADYSTRVYNVFSGLTFQVMVNATVNASTPIVTITSLDVKTYSTSTHTEVLTTSMSKQVNFNQLTMAATTYNDLGF